MKNSWKLTDSGIRLSRLRRTLDAARSTQHAPRGFDTSWSVCCLGRYQSASLLVNQIPIISQLVGAVNCWSELTVGLVGVLREACCMLHVACRLK